METTKKEIKKFQNMHMDKESKSDIAYHYIIDPAGRIWVGAELDGYQRGHSTGYFDDIAVLLLGDFDNRKENFFSPNKLNDAQKTAMESIGKWLCYEYDLLRISEGKEVAPISTHRTVNPKTNVDKGTVCPGSEAAPWIEQDLRTLISTWGS